MSMMSYCPKCGEIYFGEGICSYCGEEYVLTKYSDDEYYSDVCKYEQKVLEEYVKKSSKFDENLAKKREEEEDKVIHGKGSYVSTQSKNVPKCPTCGSTNVSKISTTKKAAGFLTVGVFSSNLGKTMECKNCGYKW